jgi:hypothetical protein
VPFQLPTPKQALDAYEQKPAEALFWTVRLLRWKMILEGTIEPKPGERVPDDLLQAIEDAKEDS